MKTATRIETVDVGRGDAFVQSGDKGVYKLSEPIAGYNGEKYDHVFVSTATVMGQPETYAFGCDAKGEVLNWGELPCSMKGDWTHADVLRDAGYEIRETPCAGEEGESK